MAEWSLAVPIRLCPLIKCMSTAILYMYICSLIAYKMFLEKGSTAKTSWENKRKNSRFDFSFILIFVSHLLLVVSLSLPECYELVLCVF